VRTDLFDYDLPKDRIAQRPAERRDASRLLIVERETGRISHRTFTDLPGFLRPGDCLVVNDTQVLNARLDGVRAATGGKVQALFVGTDADGLWRLWLQTRGRLQPGETLLMGEPALALELVDRDPQGGWLARGPVEGDVPGILERVGRTPLPPYIRRSGPSEEDGEDAKRYQTVYARHPGAVAAPTAGLHFTDALLEQIRAAGVRIASLTLHVGTGTFKPIHAEQIEDHVMHREWYEVSADAVRAIRETCDSGGRIVAVGTTAVRVLETIAAKPALEPHAGWTDLYIHPPYEFRLVDALVTNFHLPRTTLLVLVCTLAGRDLMLRAYREAVAEGYRFYSYGDAMLIE